jgi:hypothetical protein
MYALPTLRLPELELDSYRALRFTYRTKLPAGIGGLLVSLLERDHSQYCPEAAPAASEDWATVTVPLGTLRLGGWSKDENARLDLIDVGSMIIGLHGTATDKNASGVIWVAEIEFVP